MSERDSPNTSAKEAAGAAPEPVLTIVMPAYNEKDLIEATVREWHAEVIAKLPGARLVVIDDCSTDGTTEELQLLAQTLPGVDHLRQGTNGGHGRALLAGFQQVRGPFVFQTDSDRQHRAADFWRLWEMRGQFDFVFGMRTERHDGPFRQVVSALMRTLNWLLWQVWIIDANCPFKLMRSESLTAVLRQIPADAFIPMVMVSILARRRGFRVTEVSVQHLPRRGGTPSLKGIRRWTRVAWKCAQQLVQMRCFPRE